MLAICYPRFVRIDATWKCNLNCKHCQTGVFRGPDRAADLNDAELRSLFCSLSSLGTEYVGFIGGEPLLRPSLLSLLAILATLRIKTHVTTNGLLIDAQSAKFLANQLGSYVWVSLDGPEMETHDGIRGNGMFKRALQAIERLLSARNRNSSTEIGISAVLHARNHTRANQFFDLAEDLGVDNIVIAPVHPFGNAKQHWDQLSLTTQNIVDAGVMIAQRVFCAKTGLKNIDVTFFTPAFRYYLRRKFGYDVPIKSYIDTSGFSECYIQHDGKVFPSQKLSGVDPVILENARSHELEFNSNSLLEYSFEQIWHGPEFSRYRHFIAEKIHIAAYSPCSQCRFSSNFCMLPPVPYLMGESMPTPICSFVHSKSEIDGIDYRTNYDIYGK